MNKVVNIYPRTPILTVNPPIRSMVRRVTKPISDIRKCIVAHAVVEEILPEGGIVRLNLANYDKDNSVKKVDKIEIKKAEIKEKTSVDNKAKPETKNEPKNFTDNKFNKKNEKFKKYQDQQKKSEKPETIITEKVEEKVETLDAENLDVKK